MRIRGGVSQPAQLAAHVVAVHDGEIAVQDDRVVVDELRAVERAAAVMADVDRTSVAAQPARQCFRKSRLVLGDEHTHLSGLLDRRRRA